jgi:hypothetical protein
LSSFDRRAAPLRGPGLGGGADMGEWIIESELRGPAGGYCPGIPIPLPRANLAGNFLIVSVQWAVTDGVTLNQDKCHRRPIETGYICPSRRVTRLSECRDLLLAKHGCGRHENQNSIQRRKSAICRGRVDPFYNVAQRGLAST